jgi:hypothetical protein
LLGNGGLQSVGKEEREGRYLADVVLVYGEEPTHVVMSVRNDEHFDHVVVGFRRSAGETGYMHRWVQAGRPQEA